MQTLTDCIDAVAFDLDGTLIDTAPDLGAAANMMLLILGGKPLPEERIPEMIGAGIDRFVARVLTDSSGAEPNGALQSSAAALFRDLYGRQPFERSRVYPGVAEALRALAGAGITLCCVTNKESRFVLPLLEKAGLRELFACTLCAERDEDRKPSPALLHGACAHLDVEPARMLYVGDSRTDVAAARAAGCRVVTVDYGYHGGVPLADARPDAIIGNLQEITALNWSARAGLCAPRAAR
ncbi:MAG: phosphoglycolate phosphatase [Gammaproteobacteria bacterium]